MEISGHTRSAFLHGSHGPWSLALGRACALIYQHSTLIYKMCVGIGGSWGGTVYSNIRKQRGAGGHLGVTWMVTSVSPWAARWGSGRSTGGGSSPRNKWCDLGHNFSPPWALVSSFCEMKLGQKAPSFRPQNLGLSLTSCFLILVSCTNSKSCHLYLQIRAKIQPFSPLPLMSSWSKSLSSCLGYCTSSEVVSLLLPSSPTF